MTDQENDVAVLMLLDPLHKGALNVARGILEKANMIHADAQFQGSTDQHNLLDSCFNPARAAGDASINGVNIVSVVDSNFVSGFGRILDKPSGEPLDKENREIIAFLIISAMCDGYITPGMAFHEMQENSSANRHLIKSYNSFEFLCAEVDLDALCETLLNNSISDWRIERHPEKPIPKRVLKQIQNLPGGRRYKSELYSTIVAAAIELKHEKTRTNSRKFEEFVKKVYDCGAFGMGSLRYFALYFSENPSKLGVKRKSMLKQIHSGNCDSVRRGVLNAASDCYFASEYGSSINSFGERGMPRVFVTSDTALKLVMTSDFNDRSFWRGGISTGLENFRGEKMSERTAQLLNEAVPMFDAESAPKTRPQLRPSAKNFLDRQDQALADAWLELMELVERHQ